MNRRNKSAYTLAETLITLAILGVVAALSLHGLVNKWREKAWSIAQTQFENRLEVAMR